MLTVSQSRQDGRVALGVINSQTSDEIGVTYAKLGGRHGYLLQNQEIAGNRGVVKEVNRGLSLSGSMKFSESGAFLSLKEETLKTFNSTSGILEKSRSADAKAKEEIERFQSLKEIIEKRRRSRVNIIS